MARIDELLGDAGTVGIAGHVGPDGDCVGSCMGLYLYLKKNRPDIKAELYLESVKDVFHYIAGVGEVRFAVTEKKVCDCMVILDVSSPDRIGVAGDLFDAAKRTVCIDHHITNPGFADENVIEATASSASEVLYGLLDPKKVDKDCAEALYTGIVHDSGVFQYSNTSAKTLRTAAELIAKGIDFPSIIDHSFYEKTYAQNRILGKVLNGAQLYADGAVIVGVALPDDMKAYGVTKQDMDGIVSQLRLTKGVQAAIFLYPAEDGAFKVSLRANGQMRVSDVAAAFGGGGHVKAAGCTMSGTPEEIIEKLLAECKKQLD